MDNRWHLSVVLLTTGSGRNQQVAVETRHPASYTRQSVAGLEGALLVPTLLAMGTLRVWSCEI